MVELFGTLRTVKWLKTYKVFMPHTQRLISLQRRGSWTQLFI